MELESVNNESTNNDDVSSKKNEDLSIQISSSWDVDNGKTLEECVSTISILETPEKTDLEDVVSLDTCVALKVDPSGESCTIDFKVTNKQKIARIAVVSEGSILEFFKQCGEYATTVFAESVDEFQDHAVYFAEATIQPPSSEASIKFTRIKSKGTTMWVYGIKLILTEPVSDNSESMFDVDVINSYLDNTTQIRPDRIEMAKKVLESLTSGDSNSIGDDMSICLQRFGAMNWNSNRFQRNNRYSETSEVDKKSEYNGECVMSNLELKKYIDDQFVNMEKKLLNKIETMDKKINEKLDAILSKFESYEESNED